MATRNRSGHGRPGTGRYEEYNGFGEFSRDDYAGFDDEEDRVVRALRKNTDREYYEDEDGYYEEDDEYYDEDEEYYEDDEYYEDEEYDEDDEYYDEDDEYYEDDEEYYEDEPRRTRPKPKSKSKPKSRPQGKRKAPSGPPPGKSRPKASKASKPVKSAKGKKGRNGSGRQEPKKKKKVWLFILEVFIFIALLIALFVIMKWSKVNKETLTESQIYINEELKAVLDSAPEELDDSGGSAAWGMKGYKNVALFGVDAGGTRSDTIIIASINTKTYEVKMCSVYRDTYLNIDSMENPVYTKANAAYSKGGPEQAIRMLNMNLDMNVDDFITVDFDALEDIIDDLGGVEIDVQPEEVDYINDYQFSIVMDLGGPNEGKIKNPRNFVAVTQPGLQTLNGLQATAYCRIRYTSGSDFRRTERQREVISQIVQKAKGAPITTLNKILDDVLPQITTSFSAAEFAEYASRVGKYTIAETKGFPFENVTGKIGKQSMVVPDTLVSNVDEMHTFLFGPSDYSPTSNVQVISEKIESDRQASGL